MSECGDTIDEYASVDGVNRKIKHHCQKPKGHEKLKAPFNTCACGCLYRWEKIGK